MISILRKTGIRIPLSRGPLLGAIVEVASAAPDGVFDGELWYDTSSSPTDGLGVRDVTTITGNTTLTTANDVVLCDCSGGAITVTLPAAATRTGKMFDIKKIDSSGNAATIDGNGSETIDDVTTKILASQYNSVTVMSDGSEWWVL